MRPPAASASPTPSSGRPSYTQPPQVSAEPYVATTRTPASSARARRDGSTGPPPTRTVWSCASAARATGSASHRYSWVGTTDRKAPGVTTSASARSPRTAGRRPATSDRTTTLKPATYDDGSASTHGPEAPSRAADAAADASTASRPRTTCFGVPDDPEVASTTGPGRDADSHASTASTSRSASPL